MTLLTVDTVSKSYGSHTVLQACSFTVEPGTVAGLIGPNGAGKTTLLNILSGIESADDGDILLNEQRITHEPPRNRMRQGIARTFQITRPFSRMTVLENVMLPLATSREEQPWRAFHGDAMEDRRETVSKILDRFSLADHADAYAGSLSGGQKRLLELARTVLLDPVLVLMDEPFAGIAPDLIPVIMRHIRELRSNGTAFLIVEHDLKTLETVADDLLVLLDGSIVRRGSLDHIKQDEAVIAGYLGEDDA